MVIDIPAGDGKIANLFSQCMLKRRKRDGASRKRYAVKRGKKMVKGGGELVRSRKGDITRRKR